MSNPFDKKHDATFILRYECDCGRWTACSRTTCSFCKRPNPDLDVSPSFMANPISVKSVKENRERQQTEREAVGK